jgi:hypothetical protein
VYTLKPGETELEVSVTGARNVEMMHWPLDAISPDRMTGRDEWGAESGDFCAHIK